jgi:hypothetical protein
MTQQIDDAIAQIKAMTIDELRQHLGTCQNKPVERAGDAKAIEQAHWADDTILRSEK